MNWDSTITSVIANLAVIATIVVTYFTAKRARRLNRKNELEDRGEIMDHATGYVIVLQSRIKELEERMDKTIVEFQKKIDDVSDSRLRAEREAAEFKTKYESELRAHDETKHRLHEAEAELKISGYRRRSDAVDMAKSELKDLPSDENII